MSVLPAKEKELEKKWAARSSGAEMMTEKSTQAAQEQEEVV